MMKRKQRGRISLWLLVCLLAAAIGAPLLSHAEQGLYEGAGWDTPEEAVMEYLQGLKEQDIGKMISAHAVETYIDHFDLQAQLVRLRTYMMSMVPRLPNTNALARSINIESRKNEIVQSILWQMTTICLPEQDFSQAVAFGGEDTEKEAVAFVSGLDDALGAVDFSTLEVLRFIPPGAIAEMYATEANQKNLRAQSAVYGADEARSVVAVFTVDGKAGALCCDVMRYGDQWYMFRCNGNIGVLIGLSAFTGGVAAIDLDMLEDLGDQHD